MSEPSIDPLDWPAPRPINRQQNANVGALECPLEPSHKHKTAGCAFLLSEWFDLAPEPG